MVVEMVVEMMVEKVGLDVVEVRLDVVVVVSGECRGPRLAYPESGIRREAQASLWVKQLGSSDQPQVALLRGASGGWRGTHGSCARRDATLEGRSGRDGEDRLGTPGVVRGGWERVPVSSPADWGGTDGAAGLVREGWRACLYQILHEKPFFSVALSN